jgi:putative peptidoglycan lipid II flippase
MTLYANTGSGAVEERFRLARTVFSLSTIALFTKICGFGEKFVIAHFFGTGTTADVYFGSTTIILSIIWFVRELIYPSLLPVFADTLRNAPDRAGNLFRRSVFSTAVVLILAALILVGFPGLVTRMLLPGFTASKRLVSANLLRMLAPAVFCLGLAMVTYTTLNARKSFLKAAFPEAALKLLIVLGLIALVPALGIYALALVMGAGGFACLLAQLYFIPESRSLWKRAGSPEDGGAFRRVLLLMGPLVVGVVFSHISGLVDNLLASTLPSGHLSYLGYSKKLIDAVLLIGPVALVTVVYSQLSHLASAKEHAKFANLVVKSFRLLVYVCLPAACVLIVLRQPTIRCLFQRGEFGEASTVGTATAFMVYAVGLTTFALETLLVHSFFALSDTKTPVKFGILCVLVDIGLAVALLKPFGYLGIAGAFVISKTAKIVILSVILNKRLAGLFDLNLAGFLAKVAFTTVVVWLALTVLLRIDNADTFLQTAVFDVMLTGTAALLGFVLCSYLLKIDEFKAIISLLRYRKAAVSKLYEGAE